MSVHGVNVGPMFGIDVYLSSLVSIGGDANAEFLFLQAPRRAAARRAMTQADVMMLPAQQQQLYQLCRARA